MDELLWWQDSYYAWGMDFDGFYYDVDGTFSYCYDGMLYQWNPDVHYDVEGHPMYKTGVDC